MREIKFRAWVKKEDIFHKKDKDTMFTGFTFSDIENGHDEANVYCENGTWEEQKWDKAIIMQYTGLKDKNSKEIYEGDIVREPYGYDGIEWLYYVVAFGESDELRWGFYLNEYPAASTKDVFERMEIIGNLYESPELLKE
jgi:uncharacterized phage protein (TIGR01671 family)